MKSLDIVFTQKGKVEVKKKTINSPRLGEILCAADKSLVSIGTELFCLRGDFDPGTNWESMYRYPFSPGYSMAGHIIEVGRGVKGLKEGDRIVSYANHNQYFKAKAENVSLIPKEITSEEATWAPLGCTTQIGIRRAKLELGESAGVIGLGMLGQLVVQYLKASGAQRIIAIDPTPKRLELAKAHGATHILAVDSRAAFKQVEKITEKKMMDVVFEMTGNPNVLSSVPALLRILGRIILIGDTPNPSKQSLGPGVISKELDIRGVHGYIYPPKEASIFSPWSREPMTELFFDFLKQGRMHVKDLVTSRYSPLDAPKMYKKLLEDRSQEMGVILDWEKL